jgi:ankyrin repeat protein
MSSTKNPYDAISDAIEADNLQQVKDIINHEFNVNAKLDEDGGTALMLAAMWGKFEIVKYLVEAGADVNVMSISDFALSCAAIEGHHEIYEYLYPLTSPELRIIAEEDLRHSTHS